MTELIRGFTTEAAQLALGLARKATQLMPGFVADLARNIADCRELPSRTSARMSILAHYQRPESLSGTSLEVARGLGIDVPE